MDRMCGGDSQLTLKEKKVRLGWYPLYAHQCRASVLVHFSWHERREAWRVFFRTAFANAHAVFNGDKFPGLLPCADTRRIAIQCSATGIVQTKMPFPHHLPLLIAHKF